MRWKKVRWTRGTAGRRIHLAMTWGRARERASVRVCSLARSRSTCVRPLTLRSPRATMPNHRIRRIRKTDRSAAGISARPPPLTPGPLSPRTRVRAYVRARVHGRSRVNAEAN